MKVEIKVPSAGESVTEATVAAILKTSGSAVNKDDEILELETDKVNQVIYAPESGTLTLNVSVEDVVTIGQVLGSVDTEGVAAAAPEVTKEEPPKEEAPKKEITPPPPAPEATSDGPPVRKSRDEFLAEPKKEAPKVAPKKEKAEPQEGQTRKRMSGLRRTIAARLVQVKNETAMLTTFNEVDMTSIMAIRAKEKEAFEKKHGVKLGFMSFFVTAATAALQEFPAINAFIEGDEIVYNEGVAIGVAVSTEKGLMVPVIRNCQKLTFPDIEQAIVDYAVSARDGKLAIADLQGGTFTITNGGTFGSLLSTPILNPPQSGILGMHAIVKRPMAINDEVVIRPMMYLALSYDHRIVDGKEAVSFLVHMKKNLEDPARLLLDF
ncbi:MAG: dihydrolipoyllysine-residue succinyltransferase [Simkaniaceae bacterium]|nr:dihydrolipoyllysine-residue succinyltransferase [Simkaniaceae bacterium]